MSEIIQFPASNDQQKSDRDAVIDEELKSIPKKDREKIKFELLKVIDSYDGFFTEWSLSLPEDCNETLRKQIYDIAHQEHARKMLMLKDIMRIKTKVLVAEYRQRK
jgi:ABC-type uncharacterized transport system ATPase subunit